VRSPYSATQCLLFQIPVSSLFLKIIQQMLISSSSSSHPFYISFNNEFEKALGTRKLDAAFNNLYIL
jgi:hypothetical protein